MRDVICGLTYPSSLVERVALNTEINFLLRHDVLRLRYSRMKNAY